MNKFNIFIILTLFLSMTSLDIYSEIPTINCEIKNNSDITSQDNLMVYISGDGNSQILNLKMMVNHPDNLNFNEYLEHYKKGIYCTSSDETVDFEAKRIDEDCSENYKEFFYLSNYVNGVFSKNLNINYLYKVCIYNPGYVTHDLILTSQNYSEVGYTCLFKVSDLTNAKGSDCGNENFYNYLWMRVFNVKQLSMCTSSCKDTLNDRLYYSCSKKIENCKYMPIECDGVRYGSWVELKGTGTEIKCEPPWNNVRKTYFTDEKIEVDTVNISTDYNNCISKKIPVKINKEIVNLIIFECEK
jgi:hypothetical protein